MNWKELTETFMLFYNGQNHSLGIKMNWKELTETFMVIKSVIMARTIP